MNRQLTKERQMENKEFENMLNIHHWGITNKTMSYHYILIKCQKFWNTQNTNHWWRCDAIDNPYSSLVGMRFDMPVLEDRNFLSKLNTLLLLILRSNNHTCWYWPKWVDLTISHFHKNLHMNICRHFIHTWQGLRVKQDIFQESNG